LSQLKFNSNTHLDRETIFADVIVPAPIPKLFTYRIPFELNDQVEIGKRVVIQFGRKKILTGVINNLHHDPPKKYEAKYILEILDETPSLLPEQLDLLHWCADYYMSTPGDVLSVALPSGLKLSSQSFIQIAPGFHPDESEVELTGKETLLLTHLAEQSLMSYEEISELLEIKNVYQVIKSLVDKEAILLIEKVKEKYQPKTISKVRLTENLASDKSHLEQTFKDLETKPKQTDILLRYLQRIPVYSQPEKNTPGLPKRELLEGGLSPSSLKTLVKNGIMEEFKERVSRIDELQASAESEINLSGTQKSKVQEILHQFESHKVTLLRGITGSGKTEIYIELIREVIEAGGQVLYMLPEIALTTQIVKRLAIVFGNKLGIYHSKYSDNERVEVWQSLLAGQYDLVVGVRSSVFLPFRNLSLVIVDEEHETSFKQFEQSPRYNARDTAIVLAGLHHAKTLLGSATPSFESYYNAINGKYGMAMLDERYGKAVLPQIIIANLLEGRKRKTIRGDFTGELLAEMQHTLDNQKQAIIFQNRRGYSPYLSCDECANVPKCQNCSVSLTYHMFGNILRCHYCGYKEPAPKFCSNCGSNRIRTIGIGTEKIEEDLKLLLPTAKVERMDLDTTRSKFGHQQLISRFEEGEIDVLVGTQMVTKGLDFDHVRLVGVVDLDRMLHFPDFRASERCFQLVTQVSGRAGRRSDPGLVVIQTNDPNQNIIPDLIEQDFVKFYNKEIVERSNFGYPPFTRLIRLIFKNRDQETVQRAAAFVAEELKSNLGKRVLGPKEPFVNKIRNQYLMEIMMKVEKTEINLPRLKEFVKECVSKLLEHRDLKNTIVNFDVDPF